MSSLAQEYPKEQKRCRELLSAYRDIGAAGAFGVAQIEMVLTRAEEAAASEDAIAMILSYKEMEGLE